MCLAITKDGEKFLYRHLFDLPSKGYGRDINPWRLFSCKSLTDPSVLATSYSLLATLRLTSLDMNCTITERPRIWRCSSFLSNWVSWKNLASRAQSSSPFSVNGFRTGYWAAMSTRGVASIVVELTELLISSGKDKVIGWFLKFNMININIEYENNDDCEYI